MPLHHTTNPETKALHIAVKEADKAWQRGNLDYFGNVVKWAKQFELEFKGIEVRNEPKKLKPIKIKNKWPKIWLRIIFYSMVLANFENKKPIFHNTTRHTTFSKNRRALKRRVEREFVRDRKELLVNRL